MDRSENKSYRLSSEARKSHRSRGRVGSLADNSGGRNTGGGGGAIVSSAAGTTRDRRECVGRIGGTYFTLVDTAGVDGRRIGLLQRRKMKRERKGLPGSDSNDDYGEGYEYNNQNKNKNGLVLMDDKMERDMMRQTREAASGSDLVLLLFDGRIGVTPDLLDAAKWLRGVGYGPLDDESGDEKNGDDSANSTKRNGKKKVVLLANKLEGDSWVDDDGRYFNQNDVNDTNADSPSSSPFGTELYGPSVMDNLAEAMRIGFGKPLAVSACHGEGMADIAMVIEGLAHRKLEEVKMVEETAVLSNKVVSDDERGKDSDVKKERPLQLAILGRPNVGKSTLVNALLKQERVISGARPVSCHFFMCSLSPPVIPPIVFRQSFNFPIDILQHFFCNSIFSCFIRSSLFGCFSYYFNFWHILLPPLNNYRQIHCHHHDLPLPFLLHYFGTILYINRLMIFGASPCCVFCFVCCVTLSYLFD